MTTAISGQSDLSVREPPIQRVLDGRHEGISDRIFSYLPLEDAWHFTVSKNWRNRTVDFFNSPEVKSRLQISEEEAPDGAYQYLREHGAATFEVAMQRMLSDMDEQGLEETRDYDVRMPLDPECWVRGRVGNATNLLPLKEIVVLTRKRAPTQETLYTCQEAEQLFLEYRNMLRGVARLDWLPVLEERGRIMRVNLRRRFEDPDDVRFDIAIPPVYLMKRKSLDSLERTLRTINGDNIPAFTGVESGNGIIAELSPLLSIENRIRLGGLLGEEGASLDENRRALDNVVESIRTGVHARSIRENDRVNARQQAIDRLGEAGERFAEDHMPVGRRALRIPGEILDFLTPAPFINTTGPSYDTTTRMLTATAIVLLCFLLNYIGKTFF